MSQPEPAEIFIAKAIASLSEGTFVRLALSGPVADDAPQKVLGRVIKLRGALQLSLTHRHTTRDVTQNLAASEVGAWLRDQLGKKFRSALLGTTRRDWQFISNEAGVARVVDHKPVQKSVPTRDHDQKRVGVLDGRANDWLIGLGIMDRDGKIRASMADKHRQINHYLEIVSHLAKECGWGEASNAISVGTESAAAKLKQNPVLHFADMGCGKGYLTFGLWHLFSRLWKQPARVTGVETRPDLVAATNQLARQIHADGLEFVRGEIGVTRLSAVDALIALHACNTATDDAIRRGIELGAKLIVVAPCCHKEARPQLGKPEPFNSVLQHGIMAERLAEWATDGLRAMFLEWAGYRTKLMEFIGGEHTPKNLMIAAVHECEAFSDAEARERIVVLKRFLGIEHHALDSLLQEQAKR